jgi:hypothetical protein
MVQVVRMKREEEEEGERWEGRDVGCSVRMCLVSWCFVELV